MRIIIGQEAICPHGLGRVTGYSDNTISVKPYMVDYSSDFARHNVELIPIERVRSTPASSCYVLVSPTRMNISHVHLDMMSVQAELDAHKGEGRQLSILTLEDAISYFRKRAMHQVLDRF
jgi:hypothetical protein